MKKTILAWSLVAMGVLSNDAAATPDANGNYRIDYRDANGANAVYIYVPRNKVIPSVDGYIDETYNYHYTVTNRPGAIQGIEMFELRVPAFAAGLDPDRPVSSKEPSAFNFQFDDAVDQRSIRWAGIYPRDGGDPPVIAPGETKGEFVLVPRVRYLAGIASMRFFGYAPEPACASEVCAVPSIGGTDIEYPDLDAQLQVLSELSVEVDVLSPAFLYSAGAGPVDRLKAEVSHWPNIHQASAPFINRLNPKLDFLRSAVAAGNKPSARAALADLKVLIGNTPVSDLSALGAQALRFDLTEIVNRMP